MIFIVPVFPYSKIILEHRNSETTTSPQPSVGSKHNETMTKYVGA